MKNPGSLALALSVALAANFARAAEAPKEQSPTVDTQTAGKEPAGSTGIEIKDPVAVVEGVEIKKAELEKAFGMVLAARGATEASLPEEQRLQGYQTILNDMIIDKLLSKRAAAVQVSDEELAAQFEKIKANFGSEEALNQQIEKSGHTLLEVKENVRAQLRQERWIDEQLKGKGEVNEADAADYYKKNPQQFQTPEQVRASHILIAVPADSKPEAVLAKEKAAKEIAARVKKGEAFDKLAKELSEDPSAKTNSGDLDFFTKDQMVPEFSGAAFAMKQDEISEPVRSQFGYHVIKVTGRKEAEMVPLEKARPQLMAYLRGRKKQEEMEKLVRDIREKADVKVNLPPTAPAK